MLQITSKHRVFLAVNPVDFRMGIDGLARLCQAILHQSPRSGHFFVFRNRRGQSIKILTYDGQGFWLCQKRLSAKWFVHWPKADSQALYLTPEQLQVLLRNGDPALVRGTDDWQPISD